APQTTDTMTGRVVGASGRGAWRVLVSLTEPGGNIRYTYTNPFGYYRFPNITTWETYTVKVQAKRYKFTTSSVTLEYPDDVPGVNFFANNR
ncbi:MAG TPA: carboxypeptidase-like regulatory domain-containing protein, partial [Pyrinomonadaceae bacterium]|nr:carboxypeptidase-like regulatory domain-containing protein [Pyrinomonadaceae bacterium]